IMEHCRIREVNGGVITTVVGTGTCGYNGDGTSALSAQLNSAYGVAIDKNGAMYIADTLNCRVRKVIGGIISTVAGNGTCGFGADGIVATSSQLRNPIDVALDASGNVYISDSGNCRVRVLRGPVIMALAGNGVGAPNYCSYSGDGVPATSASFNYPDGLAVDPAGNVYVVDDYACTIRQVSEGYIRTIAGRFVGAPANAVCPGSYGDGGPATSADIHRPNSVALDSTGRIYISEQLTRVIRRV